MWVVCWWDLNSLCLRELDIFELMTERQSAMLLHLNNWLLMIVVVNNVIKTIYPVKTK